MVALDYILIFTKFGLVLYKNKDVKYQVNIVLTTLVIIY